MSMAAISVEEVVTFMTAAGYRKLGLPLTVASVPFEFAAAFVGTERASDLVVVLDTVDEKEEFVVRRKVEGLSRALDVAGSKRPLTTILVGPKPRMKTLDMIGRVCRVLLVGSPLEPRENWIRDALAVLLPLRLPLSEETTTDPIADLNARLPTDIEKTVLQGLISATGKGARGVEEVLRELLEEPFKHEGGTVDSQ